MMINSYYLSLQIIVSKFDSLFSGFLFTDARRKTRDKTLICFTDSLIICTGHYNYQLSKISLAKKLTKKNNNH